MQKRILIVEDEASIREMVAFALRKADMAVAQAADAREALVAIADAPPDLILLAWMLPGMSGLELARRLRQEAASVEVPIIMLTARGEEIDRVNGLEAGVDDYVVKPFSTRELVARIRAVLRRSQGDDGTGSIEIGGLRIDAPAQRVYAGDELVSIGPTEYRLLHFFMTHAERVYSRAQLLDHVWGGNVYVEERTVDVHVRRLRKTLEPYGLDRLLQTVRGTGYRLSVKACTPNRVSGACWRSCTMCATPRPACPMRWSCWMCMAASAGATAPRSGYWHWPGRAIVV
jgi:two-component system phosphate regulon response regulator PhoB